jgi:hypothetical protein
MEGKPKLVVRITSKFWDTPRYFDISDATDVDYLKKYIQEEEKYNPKFLSSMTAHTYRYDPKAPTYELAFWEKFL